MVQKKVIFIFLLLLLFTKKEMSYGKMELSFTKYILNYGNFSYHTYVSIPYRGQYLSNVMFTYSLIADGCWRDCRINSLEGRLFQCCFIYSVLFFRCVWKSFRNRKWGRGAFFLTTSILNILSIAIPQCIFKISKYKQYNILLKLNFDAGYYNKYNKNIDENSDNFTFRALSAQRSDIKTILEKGKKNNLCSICLETFYEDGASVENIREINKKVTNIGCCNNSLYHIACISAWYNQGYRGKDCPNCRQPITNSYLLKNYQHSALHDVAGEVHEEQYGEVYFIKKFFLKETFFVSMMYGDLTIGIDNFRNMNRYNGDESYKSLEIILLRAGLQVVSNHPVYSLCPFIGFCGISVSLFNFLNISIVPTYMLKDSEHIYPKKFLFDIQLHFRFKNIFYT